MVKINKIYTRGGDAGETHLVGGARVPKDAGRIQACGEVDELNAWVGYARTRAAAAGVDELTSKLAVIQNELFDLGAELASPPEHRSPALRAAAPQQVERFEQWIDACIEGLPELTSFVLPGGSELNSLLHVARTVCRRAERTVVALARENEVPPLVLSYLNRLSDLFFAMARFESRRSGIPELLWRPGRTGVEGEESALLQAHKQ